MKRPVIYLMTAIFAAGIVAPTAVMASSEGRRNTALALTAATVYAWKRYGDSRHRETRRNDFRRDAFRHHGFRRGYARGWHHGHRMACHHVRMARR